MKPAHAGHWLTNDQWLWVKTLAPVLFTAIWIHRLPHQWVFFGWETIPPGQVYNHAEKEGLTNVEPEKSDAESLMPDLMLLPLNLPLGAGPSLHPIPGAPRQVPAHHLLDRPERPSDAWTSFSQKGQGSRVPKCTLSNIHIYIYIHIDR